MTPMWQKLLCLAAAGAVGTLARYGMAGAVQRFAGAGFPWGTMAVNMSGCFVFGIIAMVAMRHLSISEPLRLFALTGFMGSFTTFSTFAYESSGMLGDRQWLFLSGNLLLHNVAGIALMLAGMALGSRL